MVAMWGILLACGGTVFVSHVPPIACSEKARKTWSFELSPHPQIELWTGPNDNTRNLRTDYFIPADLQVDFGQLKKVLSEVVTPERVSRLIQVATTRTRAVMPVFESTHHSHNISAVLRTADAFGFQDVGFVYHQPDMKFRVSDSVERGSSTWLLTRRTDSIETCARSLRASGYKIFLVSLPTFARTAEHYEGNLPSFAAHQIGNQHFCDLVGKSRIALVSGNEKFGISPAWADFADGYLHVEMNGFVESLNVSVCAGILLHALRNQWVTRNSDFTLTASEQHLLVEHWLARSCQNARQIIERENSRLIPWFEFVRGGRFYQPF
jgi:tRNA (guanosine-2'-O-)-methyltransferase